MIDELNHELKEFISAHITKWDETQIIYAGNISSLQSTIDSAIADIRYEKNKMLVEFKEYSIDHLGTIHSIAVPVFLDIKKGKHEEKLSLEYKKIINHYMKTGLISDKKGWVLFKLLNTFDIISSNWHIAYRKKEWVKLVDNLIKTKNTVSSIEIGWQIFNVNVNSLQDIDRYENIMLLVKEVQDWFYDVRSHSLTDRQNGVMVQQQYKLGQDVEIKMHTESKEIISVEQEESKYDAEKDKGWWWILTPEYNRLQTLITSELTKVDSEWKPNWDKTKIKKWKKLQEPEKISTSVFKPYESREDEEYTYIKLHGAYTHVLRDVLDFKPLTRQYRVLLNWKRFNVLAWCRRAGKTRLSAYLILRVMRMMPNSIKHVQRQVKATYIAPTEEKMKEVIDYIKTTSEAIRLLKVLDFNKKESRLYLYDEQVWRKQKVVMTVATCDFASWKGFEPGRGKASDLVIIDEAAFVKEDVRLNILPILDLEWASCFAISTIDWTTPRNRFYELLVELERWFDPEWYWLRVTIDDLDEVLVTTAQKDRMKRALKNNIQRYYAELYATFPNMQSVFNVEWFFNIGKDLDRDEQIQEVIIWYDPAKRTDTWAVMISELRSGSKGSYVYLHEEHWLQWEYMVQKEVVKSLKQFYVSQNIPTYCIIDATAAGDVVAEIFWDIIDYKVWYTAKGKRPEIDRYWAWKVPKNNLVHLTQILIEKWKMKAFVWLKNLMEELKYFKAITTQHWNTKYEAEVGHDDYVNAMMLIWFYYWYVKGEVHNFSSWQEIHTIDWVDWITWLYETFSQRWEKNNGKAPWWYWFGV